MMLRTSFSHVKLDCVIFERKLIFTMMISVFALRIFARSCSTTLFCEENELKSQLLMTIPLLEAEPAPSSFKAGKD